MNNETWGIKNVVRFNLYAKKNVSLQTEHVKVQTI